MPVCSECKWFTAHAVIPTKGQCNIAEDEKEAGKDAKLARRMVERNQDTSNCPRFEIRKCPGRYIEV